MTALVTGATGLVGSHIVRALLDHGETVRVLVRPSSDAGAIAGLPVETRVGDILDPASLQGAVAGCDTVFHAAAHFSYWGRSDEELTATAVTGTANVLEAAAAARVPRVTLTSSSVVLGSSDHPIARDEQCSPTNEPTVPYVESKILQDRLALDKARELALDVVLVCPTVVVGPFATRLGPSNALITTYLEDPFRFTFPGGCNIVAATDVGRGHVLASRAGAAGERYILAGDNLEWRALHSLISDLCGTAGPLFTASHTQAFVAGFAEEVRGRVSDHVPATTRTQASMMGRYYWYTHAKASALGFKPVPARKALAMALSWLVASAHVSRESRARLLLSGEVWAARRRLRASEAALRACV